MLDLICFLDAHPVGDHLAPFLVIRPCARRCLRWVRAHRWGCQRLLECAGREGPGSGKGARTASPWSPCLLVPRLQAAAAAAGVRGQALSAAATPTPSGLDLAFWQLFLALQRRGKGSFLPLPCLPALCPSPSTHLLGVSKLRRDQEALGLQQARPRGTGLPELAGGPGTMVDARPELPGTWAHLCIRAGLLTHSCPRPPPSPPRSK